MDAYEQLGNVLAEDISAHSAHASDPEAAPELYGVEGTDAKRDYYSKYVKGMESGLATLLRGINAKDSSVLMELKENLGLMHELVQMDQAEFAFAEGMGRVLDRTSQIIREFGLTEPSPSAFRG